MTYQETIQYLYQRLPMFQRIGKAAYKADLNNTLALCEYLGNPHRKFKSIHVAGTNGKGSSSHMLAAVFQAAGLRVGLYTSPHLKNFTERIRLNGREIEEEFVVEFVARHRSIIEKISPSFFELTVAMAFDYFAKKCVDMAVIEVGLGGRLDSTNVISPSVSLITNISLDHQDLLGNTLPQIALEKAGIIKPQTPVVISQTQEDVKDVFMRKAQEENASIYFADQFYRAERNPTTGQMNVWKQDELFLENLQLDLKGYYQCYNVVGVLKTLDVWQEREQARLSHEVLRKG
ncbi:MAG: Mur ligase family protein, partial [Flammeovirgaceae bacterium]|nr:Mur ligase family protein [Flammeovirgaceae bacterium]MDW8288691.1 Mur ligase family protein [Flammeovirgaceae bacterium]